MAIEAAEEALPGVPQVAAFDTAFYGRLPLSSAIYPLPYAWYTDWGIRRFGFHGLSHAYCAGRAAELLGRDAAGLKVVVLHLGNGCSATAVRGGVAVNTSMGFTPMDGLMMGSRSGQVDPGILLHVLRHRGLTVDELDVALNHSSGLRGVSGVSADFRPVDAAARRGDDRARLALGDLWRADPLGGGVARRRARRRRCPGLHRRRGREPARPSAVRLPGPGVPGTPPRRRRTRSCRPDADVAAPARPPASWSSTPARS